MGGTSHLSLRSSDRGWRDYLGRHSQRSIRLIHMDKTTDLYVRFVESAHVRGGTISDAVNDFSEFHEDVLTTLVKVSGASAYRRHRIA